MVKLCSVVTAVVFGITIGGFTMAGAAQDSAASTASSYVHLVSKKDDHHDKDHHGKGHKKGHEKDHCDDHHKKGHDGKGHCKAH